MQSKQFYQSKTFWFNAIMTIVDIAAISQDSLPDEFKSLAVMIHGIGGIVLRVWFTKTSIVTSKEE